MSDWTIQQMRDAVDRGGAFVVGGSFADVCDWLELPETSDEDEGGPTQQTVPPPAGVLVDIQTANAIVTVHDALSEENRERFVALRVERAGAIAWKLVKSSA